MSQHPNPFVRGYWNLRIARTLSISYEDGSPHVWRPLHASQQHLGDEELLSSSCIVTNDFALISNGTEPISAELLTECDAVAGASGDSVVGAVVYAIHGDDFDGRPIHIGDTYSSEAAREAVQRLNFETGYYSRCWEISAAHLSERSWQYLFGLASREQPENFLFVVFPIPESPAIGIKLISTPWTDRNLEHVMGIGAGQLRQEHQDKGMPDDLVNILELAGQADVRILIFDGDAPALLGLPLVQSDH
ncbi:ABC transporter substrate-binding protein [Escherichia coli]